MPVKLERVTGQYPNLVLPYCDIRLLRQDEGTEVSVGKSEPYPRNEEREQERG
jgi:hypothetical protein